MMRVRVDMRGLARWRADAAAAVDAALEATAQEGERMVKDSFGSGAAGRTYRRGGSVHTASAAGSPPRVDSGRLRNAITVYRLGRFRWSVAVRGVTYAAALEFGSRRMAARPFMLPMAATLGAVLVQNVADAVRDTT